MTAAANANVIATSGALGYRAPELSKLKKANRKTDVHSLGVIMLELLTGKSPAREVMNSVDLPRWVASMAKEESSNQVFDVDLMNDASIIGDELLTALKLALHCVHPSPLLDLKLSRSSSNWKNSVLPLLQQGTNKSSICLDFPTRWNLY
nr:probable leucine-rich repeat receptor-like protein kinase IMK3 isoform X2 [Ipomoea trifida]